MQPTCSTFVRAGSGHGRCLRFCRHWCTGSLIFWLRTCAFAQPAALVGGYSDVTLSKWYLDRAVDID
eukprot:1138728-Pelagomonas_calceolata.AAC.1